MNKSVEILVNNYPIQIALAQERAKPKVACLGPAGTYTEAARHQLLGNSLHNMAAEFLPNNAAVVQSVEAGDYDIGIVPVENAIEGDVVEVLRELNHAKNITILGEEILGIQHMLIGRPDTIITEIRSHPQALGQCRTYLLDYYPGIKQEASPSTTAAAEFVLQNRQAAAIASRRAAQIYGLPILAEDIGDIKGNSTRFLMLGRGKTYPTGQDSTALIFTPKKDYPGVLADCLYLLGKEYQLNLTKIDSRPTGTLRQYAFWITIEGHYQEEMVKKGINALWATYCADLRMLGSYRTASLPQGVKEPGVINGQSNH